jgi:hypothetical protein
VAMVDGDVVFYWTGNDSYTKLPRDAGVFEVALGDDWRDVKYRLEYDSEKCGSLNAGYYGLKIRYGADNKCYKTINKEDLEVGKSYVVIAGGSADKRGQVLAGFKLENGTYEGRSLWTSSPAYGDVESRIEKMRKNTPLVPASGPNRSPKRK